MSNVELILSASQWNETLCGWLAAGGPVRLMSYTLPAVPWAADVLAEASAAGRVEVLCHAKCRERADCLLAACPGLSIRLHHGTHAKCVIGPAGVMIGSVNLGDSGWFEAGVLVRSGQMARNVYARLWLPAWRAAERLGEDAGRKVFA